MKQALNAWKTDKAVIFEVPFGGDLHEFVVLNPTQDRRLGTVVPRSFEDMTAIIDDLNAGCCPVEESWEDGLGGVITELPKNKTI